MKRRAHKAAMDVLCPMHLMLSGQGIVTHAGPTLLKLFAERPLIGEPLMHVLTIKRPRAITSIDMLRRFSGVKLHLETAHPPQTPLKGVLMPMGGVQGNMILNLGFGISIVEAVGANDLTNSDFAPTDLAMELLYLVEAKTAAMDASRHLNLRLQGAKIAAEEQAFTDTLTGLKNRRALDMVLSRRVEGRIPYGIMQVDLDHFKEVNDRMGHAAGDFVLQAAARILVDETRDLDTVARVGGDEFTIVLPEVSAKIALSSVAKRIIRKLEQPIPFNGEICQISASIGGLLVKGDDTRTQEELAADADLALYASKNAGRGRYSHFHPRLRAVANTTVAPQRPKVRRATR